MALTKTTTFSAIIINPSGSVTIQTKITAFDDDGSEIGYKYNRRTIEPTDDITGEPLKIRQICNIARS